MSISRHLISGAAAALMVWSIGGLVTRDDMAPSGPAVRGEVLIASFAFGPEVMEVKVGSTVTWTNTDGTDHTVDSEDRSVDSEAIGEGETFGHTFDTPGTFSYICAFHPFMKGTVEVTG